MTSAGSKIGGLGMTWAGLVVTLAWLVGSAAPSGAAGLFEEDSTLAIVLEGPWRSIHRERDTGTPVGGRLVLAESSGESTALDIRIKTRGKWRLEHCGRPPLTLELQSDQIAATTFAGQTVVHLTPQCRRGERYQQHVVWEYVIFRVYGLLSDVSLRARLVSVEYHDPEHPEDPRTGVAVLVEDLGLAARRLGLEWSAATSTVPKDLNPESAAMFVLFQYMIGHTDWSILRGPDGERCCHNAALMKPVAPLKPAAGYLAVPYDFDASGLVDTGEIEPSEKLPIQTVRQRLYRGFCIHDSRIAGTIERMRQVRPEIEALIGGADLMSPKSRRRADRFVAEFYEIVEDPVKLESRILSKCRE